MSLYEGLGISVLASLLTVILLKIGKIVINYMSDQYVQRFTEIPDINGIWTTENYDEDGNSMKESMRLKQHGSILNAEIDYEIEFKDGRAPRHKTLKAEGIIKNDIVTMFYINKNKREKGAGCLCVELTKDGDELKGHYTWWDVEIEKIVTSENIGEYIWKRS